MVPLSQREAPYGLRRRLGIGFALVLAGFLVLTGRLWFLQVLHGEEMHELAHNNRIRLHRVPATRGRIVDRYGRVLVDSRPAFSAVLVREDAADLEATVGNVARVLGQTPEEVHQILATAKARPRFAEVTIKRDLAWEEVVALETHQLDMPGVTVEVTPRRSYPLAGQLAHLLGYVGEVSPEDIGRDRSYRPADLIGKSGLERYFEEELRGVEGGEQVEVNAVGRQLQVLRSVPEQPGNTVRLTIDLDLQQAAANALGERDGSVVALDPRNGEVLAFVNYPSYDPNVFARGIKAGEWRALIEDEHHPLTNRGLQGQYPPGSAFKIPVAAAALEEGIINPFTRIYCPGGYKFGDRYFRCWHRGGHGSMTLHDAIVHSCDVFFYQVSQRLGIDTLARYARDFGYGLHTGLEFGSESPGTIPDQEWKRKRFGQPWYAGETLSAAIGQGYVTATPLQMANMAAAVAVGQRLRPHFVMQVERPDGELVRRFEPEVVAGMELKDSTIALLREAMHGVVHDEEGTGKRARLEGIEVAGKTLTSQVVRLKKQGQDPKELRWRHRDHAGFVSFAPVEAPELAVAVLVEHADGGGGKIAAPIARDVFAAYFELKQQRLGETYAQGRSSSDRPL
jgi:penicillin-binding protein 2